MGAKRSAAPEPHTCQGAERVASTSTTTPDPMDMSDMAGALPSFSSNCVSGTLSAGSNQVTVEAAITQTEAHKCDAQIGVLRHQQGTLEVVIGKQVVLEEKNICCLYETFPEYSIEAT